MGQKLFYEDVHIGTEIPALTKHISGRQVVMWACATSDFYEVHYDKDFAQKSGLPGVIAHGWLAVSFLGQLLTDWIGDDGAIRKLECSYRGIHPVGETVTCKGKVTNKYVRDGNYCVECEIWAENSQGKRTTPGSALVILPSKAKQTI